MANTPGKSRLMFAASAPGRADFLNTHQDYKGLPVVPVALDLRTYIGAAKTKSAGVIEITSIDLKERKEEYGDIFTIGESLEYAQRGFFGNYLRAVAKVVLPWQKKSAGKRLRNDFGLQVVIKSEVPMSAGLASSAALEVAFAKLLNEVYKLGLDEKDIAEAAYRSENVELGIPCGRLDQYGSSFGGVVLLECIPPYKVKRIPFNDLNFVVADSGIRHSTAEIHPKRQSELNRGLKALVENERLPRKLKNKLGLRYDLAKWSELTEEELQQYLSALDEVSCKRILFTLRMQKSTELALAVMEGKLGTEEVLAQAKKTPHLGEFFRYKKADRSDPKSRKLTLLGSMMNYQHLLLRDLYDVSLPEIEAIRDSMLEVKAYGAKISGAGLGGSVIALVGRSDSNRATLEAALNAGAKQGWVSAVGSGARMEDVDDTKVKRVLPMSSA